MARDCRTLFCSVLVLFIGLSVLAPAAMARNKDMSVCDHAAQIAATEYGIPPAVLMAIGRTESGVTKEGRFVPWPWTINVEGQGVRFDTKQQALEHFKQRYARGARNIDLGCFQVNHRWHGENFTSALEMLDPMANAQYAAGFLSELYDEFGDWTRAVGAFHSRNHEFSSKYLARYEPILRNLDASDVPLPRSSGSLAENGFPLLTGSSQSRAMGSLFPNTAGNRGSLFNVRDERG